MFVFNKQNDKNPEHLALELARDDVVQDDLANVAQHVVLAAQVEQNVAGDGANQVPCGRVHAQKFVRPVADQLADGFNQTAFKTVLGYVGAYILQGLHE